MATSKEIPFIDSGSDCKVIFGEEAVIKEYKGNKNTSSIKLIHQAHNDIAERFGWAPKACLIGRKTLVCERVYGQRGDEVKSIPVDRIAAEQVKQIEKELGYHISDAGRKNFMYQEDKKRVVFVDLGRVKDIKAKK